MRTAALLLAPIFGSLAIGLYAPRLTRRGVHVGLLVLIAVVIAGYLLT